MPSTTGEVEITSLSISRRKSRRKRKLLFGENIALNYLFPKVYKLFWNWKKWIILKLSEVILGCDENNYFHIMCNVVEFNTHLCRPKYPNHFSLHSPLPGAPSILWGVGRLFPEITQSPSFWGANPNLSQVPLAFVLRWEIVLVFGALLDAAHFPALLQTADAFGSFGWGKEWGSKPLGNWMPAEHSWLWVQLDIEEARQTGLCACLLHYHSIVSEAQERTWEHGN